MILFVSFEFLYFELFYIYIFLLVLFVFVFSVFAICIFRSRLRAYEQFKGQAPITDCVISPMGNLMIYSLCYDWSMGKEGYNDQVMMRAKQGESVLTMMMMMMSIMMIMMMIMMIMM
jgi:hypothetical protein